MATDKIIFKGGVEVHYALEASDTNKQHTLFKCIVPSGARTPIPHYHDGFDETVYGLKGTVYYNVDGKSIEIEPGDTLFIPRGGVHNFENRTKETVEFLCYINPGIFGAGYFHDMAAEINKSGPPDVDKLKAIMKSHGLVPVIGLKHSLIFSMIRIIKLFKK